jgi:hypothetical protein
MATGRLQTKDCNKIKGSMKFRVFWDCTIIDYSIYY